MRFTRRIVPFPLLALLAARSLFANAEMSPLVAQLIDTAPNPPLVDCYLDCATTGLHVVGPLELFTGLHHGEKLSLIVKPGPDGTLCVQSLKPLGHYALGTPLPCTSEELPLRHFQPSSIRGTIQSAVRDETNPDWNWMTLRTAEGKLPVAAKANEYPLVQLRKLIDAEVILKGYSKPLNTWREGLGPCFVLLNDFKQEIETPSPADLPLMPAWQGKPSPHRQRLQGKTIAASKHVLYLLGPKEAFYEVKLQAPADGVKPGDVITAAGFIEQRPDGLSATEAIFKVVAHDDSDTDIVSTLSLEQLFPSSDGQEIINHKPLHHLIRLSGNVIGRAERPAGQRVLLLGDNRHSIEIDFSGLPASCYSDINVGCAICVTGLCLADVDYTQEAPANLHFRTFSVLPRTAGDIRVLSRPSWWTPARLLVVIGVLMIALAGILVWNRSLKVLSERRGRSLFKEQIAHATAELRTGERTRIAVELHDSLSQNLAGVALQISAAKMKQGPNPAAAATHLETAERMLRSSRTELRRCLWDLREEMLDEKVFADAIAKSVDPVSADAAIDIRFNVPRQRLTDTSAHAILRIIRELVSNAVTHGRATRIRIAGECHDNELSFSVTDNGSGFDTRDCPGVDSGHFGLDGIRERVRRLNGTLALDSRLGKGTRAVVRVPIIHPQQPADEHS